MIGAGIWILLNLFLKSTPAHAQEFHRHPHGFSVITFQDQRLPVFDATWVIPHAGSAITGEIVARILEKKLSTLERWGTSLTLDPDQDWILFQLKGFRKNSAEILSEFEKIIFESEITEKEIAAEKAHLIERMDHVTDNPESIAQSHLFGPALYPSTAQISKITHSQVLDFYRTAFQRKMAPLVVIGKIQDTSPLFSLPLITPSSTAGTLDLKLPLKKTHPLRPIKRIILHPGSDQVVVRILIPVPPAFEADSETLWIANTLLGGNASSRLSTRIRDELGLTFGIGSQLFYKRMEGYWIISTSTRKELANQLVSTIQAEINHFFKDGITADELEFAKKYLSGSFPVNLASPVGLASQWMFQKLVGMSDPGLTPLLNRIQGMPLERVNKMLKKLNHPEKQSWVIVGPAGAWTHQLERQFPSK